MEKSKAMNNIMFFGDAFLPEIYTSHIGDIGPYVLNLEYPITTSTSGYPNKINLKSDANYLKQTIGHNPVAVCLANNHIIDYGEVGFSETIKALDRDGIKYFGAGYRENFCNNPAIIEFDNIKIALLGYVCSSTSPTYVTENSPGVLPLDVDSILNDMSKSRASGADRVVVSLHWGAEEISLPKPEDIKIARQLVDGGADLIVGHHAHHIQYYETYKDKYIFYGLGNFIFPDISVDSYFDEETGESACTIEKKMKWWNKRSIAVAYNPRTNNVSYKYLHFDGKNLTSIGKWRQCPNKKIALNSSYQKRFRRSYLFGKMLNIMVNFIYKPKLPGIRHIKGIISVLRAQEYK